MTLSAFIKNLFAKQTPAQTFTGANLDNRSAAEKANDIHFSEIVGTANAVAWAEKYPDKIRKFPDLNQFYTNMCGAFALAKSLGIMFFQKYGVFINFFPPDIYQRRVNKGVPGMMLYDMMRIAAEGVTLTQFFNANYTNDSQAEGISIEQWHRDVGKVFSVKGDVVVPIDIDVIASVIQTTGKAPIGMTWFLSPEWSVERPTILNRLLGVSDPSSLRHFTCYPDFTLINGVKHIVTEDSAWFGGLKRRYLSEDWIKNRIVEIRYPMSFKFAVGAGDKPTYDGQTIISAQKCLRYEGFFPTNIDYAENVGSFTRQALKLFQQKYALAVTQQLDTATKKKLAMLYP
jgi:hypothetical protein